MFKPDPANQPALGKAVKDIDDGHPEQAIEPLRCLVLEYPDHPLPATLLGIAQGLSHGILEDDAQVSMNKGLNLPSAEAKLLEWARRYPSLPKELQGFVTSRIERLREYKANLAKLGISSKQADDLASERKYYETMSKVLDLALKIDPESNTLRVQAAMVDEYFGNQESAHGRLTKLIDATRARGDRNDREELDRLDRSKKPGRS